ncbi:MAG: LPS-assembly protein LptD [Alphaproteobacteria bacterium]|nr:LPS-assembly protein LptD [Alphaproteobacteria bacterium]
MYHKIKSIIFGASAFVFLSSQAFAVTEAGEFQHKEHHSPSAQMYVTNNIANLDVGGTNDEVEEIKFSADEMNSDDKTRIITATGDVEIIYNQMRLLTDKLIYDQNKDVINAEGNVRIYTSDGSVIVGDRASLADNLTVGEMYNIKVLLKDKSHVFAEKFRKKGNHKKVMHHAAYTACDFCKGVRPLWEVNARKVQHDEETQNVHYNDAVLKFKGVPAFYTPFLSHPDPMVKRRSGFLMPTMGSTEYLGGFFQPRYFWAVNDQTNVIFSPIYSADKGIVWDGSYKQYFYNSYFSLAGSYLKDKNEGKDRAENRGYAFASGRYDINNDWRLKYNLKYVSDYLYLKEMNLPYDDDAWLNSQISFERFSGRDYVSVDAYYYKMLSYNLHRRNVRHYKALDRRKPIVAPLMYGEFYTDQSSIGSYFKTELGSASIYRQDGSESQRLTAINSWVLPMTSAFGEKYRFIASVKSDAYYVNKYEYETDNRYNGATGRIFPQAGIEWRLPFVRATDDSRQIIEPVVVGVLAPEGGNKAHKIPNEDSEDVYFDDTNVLDLDRYAGYDRNDTGSRVSYGMRWNSYGDIFGRTSAFFAQTYEYNKRSDFLSALDRQSSHLSDYVGRIYAQPNQYLDLNYRFRIDRKKFKSKYDELGTGVGPSFLRAYISYIFLQGNTHYNDLYFERKEIYTSLRASVSQYWSVSVYNLRDLRSKRHRNLEHGGKVIYDDECLTWETTLKRYNSSNPNLDNDYEFTTTFYLKTIGSFGS